MNRLLAKAPVRWFIAMLVLLTAAASVLPATRTLVFSKGETWTYEGTVAWHDGTKVQSKHIRLVTKVVEVVSYASAKVAVVRGFPSELAWYGDNPHPQYSLLVLNAKGLVGLDAASEKEARELAHDFPRVQQELRTSSDAIVNFPLLHGSRFRSPVKGAPASRASMVYQSTYQTNPDHVIVDFVPGLGVVRYVYEHHGTTSSVDVRLVEIKRGRRARI